MSGDRTTDMFNLFAKDPRQEGQGVRQQQEAHAEKESRVPPSGGTSSLKDPAQPAMWCSDCRAVSRTNYYAVNGRAVCAKCKPAYSAKIAHGSGRGSLQRVLLRAGGTALASALIFGIAVSIFGFFRLFGSLAIGYFIAKAITQATDSYFMRRYQWLAVGLTYFAVGLGSLIPVVKGMSDERKAVAREEQRQAERRAKRARGENVPYTLQEQRLAAQGFDVGAKENLVSAEGSVEPAAQTQLEALADSLIAEAESPKAVPPTGDRAWSRQLVFAGLFSRLGILLVMVFVLPILGMFGYGLYGGVLGLFALGFAMKKAHDTVSNAVAYEISGPHRVGTGPIPATI